MNIKRGYSDSKLSKMLKPKFDEDNLDNFLPKFLLKDVPNDVEVKDEMEIPENDKFKTIFDSNESDEISEYLKNMSMKENVNSENIDKGEMTKFPRSKFYKNVDLKQYAKDQKEQMYNQYQNQIYNQMGMMNGINYNMNYNLNQNIHQGLNQSGRIIKMYASSPNDSGNFSFGSDYASPMNYFAPLRPAQKKNYSSSNVIKSGAKLKSSLFISADKEEKGEDFADLDELMSSLTMELWDYARTQRGSRNLQKLLNKIQPESLNIILEKLKDHFPYLMVDTYGNYFCQKLIQSSSSENRMFILKQIMKQFPEIACNPSGTHSLQSMIEIINMPGEEDLVKEAVKDHVLKLSYDINGTHVMQKVISCIDEDDREFINLTVLKNISKLLYDPNGICVLKKFINGNKTPYLRKIFLDNITKNALEIVQNPFGNYVIQHILDEWGPLIAKDIIEVIIHNIISLSMQKFSSNVVEKCFDLVDQSTRKRMIKELFNAGKISSLLKNKYGNFVLQKAISIMSSSEKKEIKDYLIKRVNFTSNKEKARLTSLIDII